MSVQLVKWFILVFALFAVIAASCRISTATNAPIRQKYATEYIDSPSHNVFDSFMSLLRWSAVDLTKEISHPTVDKKAFNCLLVYLYYHLTHFSDHYQDVFTTHPFPNITPDAVRYFVYTLHRIIV